MKYLILLICSLLLFACSNSKRVYWCGDHACINNKERESYFKKTMIVETRELSKKNKKSKSEIETIQKQAILEQKKEIKNEKIMAKQARLEEKRKIKKEKELAQQARLETKRRIKKEKELAQKSRLKEKRRIKEEKELARQVSLEEKQRTKNISKREKKSPKKKALNAENKEILINTDIASSNISSNEFEKLVEKITKKNMFKTYPNIDDIPN